MEPIGSVKGTEMTTLQGLSQHIWEMKYRFTQADGTPVDNSIEDTWRRVAKALAAAEKPSAQVFWEDGFAHALDGFKFIPAGRILAGAGTERDVTLFNCFVMGTIPDDMGGIFESLKEAALTLQQGGGIGYDFSTLRPKGALVRGVGADASGPLSFMDVWDSMCRTIMSAGSRRGAMMATLRCDHPDIEAFIAAKQDSERLRMFNLSVLVTDDFIAAVKADEDWPLVFDGKTYRTVSARALWDKIMQATYDYAEPGVVFIDRINRKNNLNYCETIAATNPCVTADTWVQTSQGPRQVANLIGQQFEAIVDDKSFKTAEDGFFKTGQKPVVQLKCRHGQSLRLTANHQVRRVKTKTQWRREVEWTAAGDLSPGDLVVLHNHREASNWPGFGSEAEGYLVGLLIGDGTLKTDKAVLSVWPGRKVANGDFERPGVAGVMHAAFAAASTLPHRSDFTGWVDISERGEQRMALGAVKNLAHQLGLRPGHKKLTPEIERTSSSFYQGFLRGFFDADGSIQGTQKKGVSVRLTQSNLSTLTAVQRMLLRLGIASSVYTDRHSERMKLLPDGRGGKKEYNCAAVHELVISKENVARFAAMIGFEDYEKQGRLNTLLSSYKRKLNREYFVAEIESIIEAGEEIVYDVTVPEAHAFDANGFYVHNCGEQPLPPYGACLLGSVNLARLVKNPFSDEAHLDEDALAQLVPVAVRMMDNAIDVSKFPLPEQQQEANAKRRIGLGVTGLADALVLCGVRYGSDESLVLIERWMRMIRDSAYRSSAELAAEKGTFPLYDKDAIAKSDMVRSLPKELQDLIAENGLRNALLTSIAPTGTISLLADNTSSGIEPIFDVAYSRKVLQPDGSSRTEDVVDYAVKLFRTRPGNENTLPENLVTTNGLTPKEHVAVQAAVQKYVDSSISKTVNVPEDISFDDFKSVYMDAWNQGLKGCTTYRPNAITGAVLLSEPAPSTSTDVAVLQPVDGDVVYMTEPLDRPAALEGHTYKIKWPDSDHAMYITLNDIESDGRRRPFEIFINSKNMEHYAWTLALTRMISAVFRRGGDVSFVVEELKAVFDPRGGQWVDGEYVPSLLAAIGKVIEQHMIRIGFLKEEGDITSDPAHQKRAIAMTTDNSPYRRCPKCSAPALIRQEGCDTCTNCGYSKCS